MLLKVPPPDVIDHAAVVALPPMVAPDKVIAEGVADWQTTSGPPAATVGAGVTVTVVDPVTFVLQVVQELSITILQPRLTHPVQRISMKVL